MTEADRKSYARQFEAAQRRLPRRHVINHCIWRDGQLSTQSAPVERQAKEAGPEFSPRVRRGATQEAPLLI